jgi:hypothetical protein
MQGQIVLSLVILQKVRYAALLARPRERGAKAVKHLTSLKRRVFRGLEPLGGQGAARCPITLGADQSIFGATRGGPMRAPIAGLDIASWPCPRKWPWTSENGGFLGLLPFPSARLEMTSSSLVEIRHSAISTCPPFLPPTGGRPTLNVVGQPRP